MRTRLKALLGLPAPLRCSIFLRWSGSSDWVAFRSLESFISSVKNQGSCGSCVAFGTTAAVDAMMRIQADVALGDPGGAAMPDLSEAELFYCGAEGQGRACAGPNAGWWVSAALGYCQTNGLAPESYFRPHASASRPIFHEKRCAVIPPSPIGHGITAKTVQIAARGGHADELLRGRDPWPAIDSGARCSPMLMTSGLRESALAARFELRGVLGEGGMGIVHRAWDHVLGKEVALKRMREVGAAHGQKLKAEFRARSALRHPNLVQLYELVLDGESCFFTMELVEGTGLHPWLQHRDQALARTEQWSTDSNGGHGGGIPPSADGPPGTQANRTAPSVRRVDDGVDLSLSVSRFWPALVQLCQGLAALHDAGIVHRDVKPSNVLVTPTGRVVLVDFGVAARSVDLRGGTFVGTPRYMAPELIRREPAGWASDMYAVGIMIRDFLLSAGFPGPARAPLSGRDQADLLATLAMDLVHPTPASRPDAREVLRRMGASTSLSTAFGAVMPGAFVGRDGELAALHGAFARVTAERRPLALVVEGPSGIGKSTLVRRFVAELKTGGGSALSSRCHPQEMVPFKALDAAMDAIALDTTAHDCLGTFSPALAQAATRLFPVLASVPALSLPGPTEPWADEGDLRERGFEALRCLLARLGPLVLWIDDVQWDDQDSQVLLEALLRPLPSVSEMPAILLVLTLRSESRESAILRRLEERPFVPLQRIQLGQLSVGEVAKLAWAFLPEGDPRIRHVIAQSEGNPFLAAELARYMASRATPSHEPLDLRMLVASRLRELSASEQAILNVVSMAGRPLLSVCALEAARLTKESRTDVIGLRDALLLRSDPGSSGELLAPYHDKIAEAALYHIAPERKVELHRALAEALERHCPEDADALCVHWEGAEQSARASVFAYRAAESAASKLAFDRAALLYEKAIALGFEGVESSVLFERAATSHANHGRGATAAQRYLDASRASGDDVRHQRVRTLKRLAAEQYVKSGYVREGWEVMRSVLDAAEISTPRSAIGAASGALRRRIRFLLKRIDLEAIGDRQIPAERRPHLDILWTASTSMSMVDVTLSDAFRTRHLGSILDVGDASSIARALAYEAALEVHLGGPFFDWHAARLLGHVRRLVQGSRDPYDEAWLDLAVANQAYCAGRFGDAVAACRRSERILRDKCRGVAWEITTVAAFFLTSLAMTGDLKALGMAVERFAADAESRGDLFGMAEAFGGECILSWWCSGRGGEALARATSAAARQGGDAVHWPERTYRRGQLTALMANVHMSLLVDDPLPAWEMMKAQWAALRSALVPSLQFYRSWVRHGRARAALAAAQRCRSGLSRESFLRDARMMARHIARDKRPFGLPWAALIEGALSPDRGAARALLERSMAGFERAGMALYREAARWRLAELTRSKAQRDHAEAWMREQGVPDPEALARALAPGYG